MKACVALALSLSLVPLAANAQSAPPAQAAPCPPLKQIGTVKLEKSDDRWLIPVRINGTPKLFVFNPGIGASVIADKTVKELKLKTALKRPDFQLNVLGRADMAHYDSLVIGTVGQFTDGDIIVQRRITGRADPENVAGMLGFDFFGRFDFDMDLANGVVNIFDPDHCEGQVVYWKTDAAFAVPFTVDAFGQVRIPVILDGVEITANLVPGSKENRMPMDNARKYMKLTPSSDGVQPLPAEEGVRQYSRRFGKLEIAGLALSNPVIVMYDGRPAGAIGVTRGELLNRENEKNATMYLGHPTLSRLHIYFAAKEQKFYISPAAALAPSAP